MRFTVKIEKALKRQKAYKKLFFISMAIISGFLPIVFYLSNIRTVFMMVYLILIELLILFAIIIKLDFYRLEFSCQNGRLKFKSGIFSNESLILCKDVAIVHANKSNVDIEIIIVTSMNLKNKRLRLITEDFMQRYPEASHDYLRLKRLNPEVIYYFQIIRKGALKKYILLDIIYKNCVNGIFTASAIENIKIARGQNEI